MLLPTYRKMLGAFDAWLAKAEADGKGDDLMGARLAPDMFPLTTQVRFACLQAYEGVARLSNRDLPDAAARLLAAGRVGGDAPGTLSEARAAIAETLAMLDEADAAGPEPSAPLAHELPNGMIFDLTAEQYVRDWALPQFYFHLMAGYAILRAEGVSLGKPDYVAHKFTYLRPGTMPRS